MIEGMTPARERVLEIAAVRGGGRISKRQVAPAVWLKDCGLLNVQWWTNGEWLGCVKLTQAGQKLMARPRPAIPVEVKVRVALRQIEELWPDQAVESMRGNLGGHLEQILIRLAGLLGCNVEDLRLDHEPQLALRPYDRKIENVAARYTPNANDPDALIYRPQGRQFVGSHDVKSNVRGDHGQLSDTALRKKMRKVAKRLVEEKLGRSCKPKRSGVKRKIPSRPFPKRRPKT